MKGVYIQFYEKTNNTFNNDKFSLVPTVNIIACESKAEEEIVGETIAQEIVDGAINEINEQLSSGTSVWVNNPAYKGIFEGVVSDIKKNPEYMIMHEILLACANVVVDQGNDKSKIALLKLDLKGLAFYFTKHNFKKFKIIPLQTAWYEEIKKLTDGTEKQYDFKLKFGKTLSTKTVKIMVREN